MSFATNGRYVLAGSEDKIQLLDHHGKRLWNYSVSSPVYSVSLSENGETIAAGTATGIVVFDGNGNVQNEYRLDQTVCPVMVSRDGTAVAALSGRLFFPVREGTPVQTLSENDVSAGNNTTDLPLMPTTPAVSGFTGVFCIPALMGSFVFLVLEKRGGIKTVINFH